MYLVRTFLTNFPIPLDVVLECDRPRHLDVELASLAVEEGEKKNRVILIGFHRREKVFGRFPYLVRH